MVQLQESRRKTTLDSTARNRAFLLVAVGILVVLAGHLRLVGLPASGSATLPIVLAVVGFLVASLGFSSFALRERTAHFRRTYGESPAGRAARGRDRSLAPFPPRLPSPREQDLDVIRTYRKRWDFPHPN